MNARTIPNYAADHSYIAEEFTAGHLDSELQLISDCHPGLRVVLLVSYSTFVANEGVVKAALFTELTC